MLRRAAVVWNIVRRQPSGTPKDRLGARKAAPDIAPSTLGEFECAIGVAAIAHHEAFDVSNIELADEGRGSGAVQRTQRP